MKTKLLSLFLALASAFMAEANVLLDWDNIDPSYLYSCSRPTNTEYKALKYMKAACDARYLYIRAGFDTQHLDTNEDLGDDGFGSHPGVPFHVFLNNDRTNNGFIGMWNTPSFILTEGFLFESGRPVSAYTPSTFYWVGDEPSRDWMWDEYSNQIVTESIVTNSTVELQISLAALPFTCNEYIHVGVEIENEWNTVGLLPLGEDNPEIGGFYPGIVDMAKVKISPTPINRELVINHLGYNINKNTKTASVVDCEDDITNIEIPNTIEYEGVSYSVTTIGDGAFESCTGLISVTIPNSVTTIGYEAFKGCSGLTSVTLNSNAIVGLDNLGSIFGQQVIEYTIGNSVTTIGKSAFSGCSGLTSVTIPNSVTTIGEYAFYKCSGLTSVTIPNSVTTIGIGAFAKCSGLVRVEINSNTYLSQDFYWDSEQLPYKIFGSQVTEYVIGDSVTTIGEYAFRDCSGLTSVTIGNFVKTIGNYAFYVCSGLTSVTIPNSVTTIKKDAFSGCSGLTKINYTGTIAQWCKIEFDYDYYWSEPILYSRSFFINDVEVKDLVIPNFVTKIGEGAFSGCSGLTSVTIGNSVTTIGNYAFEGCSNLSYINFGGGLQSIGDYAFADCKIDTAVIYATTPPYCDNWAFRGLSRYAYLLVPQDCERAYKLADGWNSFDIHVQEANIVPTENKVIVSTSDQNVTITWPINDNASAYTLIITKSGETVCTLTFNAQGQLLNIAFAAPGHNGTHQAPAATLTAQGYQFTVTGLNPGTAYNYSVTATDAGGQTLAEHKGNFSTTGGTGFESVHGSQCTMHKYFHNGNLIIERNGAKYTATGQKVR